MSGPGVVVRRQPAGQCRCSAVLESESRRSMYTLAHLMPTGGRKGEVVEKTLSVLRTLMTAVLAVAAAYSAYMANHSAQTAQETAKIANESAEAAKESAQATRDSAEAARKSAEAATVSAAVAREWLESSERALIAPTSWSLILDPSGVVVVQAELRDVGDVPTTLNKVCVWQSLERPAADVLKNYRDALIPGGTLVYREVFQRVRYPVVALRMQDGNATSFLSTLYTFSREGTSTRETWKAEARANFTRSGDQLSLNVAIEDFRPVEEQLC